MSRCRILIVEDDPVMSLHLEGLVAQALDADVFVARSAGDARSALSPDLRFALLDVDVLDGTTYDFAMALADNEIPFAFLSGSNREQVPERLRGVPFLSKPYDVEDVVRLLRTVDKS